MRTTSPPRTTTCSSRVSGASAGGLGYFGFSYYEQNQDKLNLVGIDAGDGCVKPSTETIQDGDLHAARRRPLFMYPSAKALKQPEVKAFMDYVVENYEAIAEASQIVPMSQEQADKAKSALGSRSSGSRVHSRAKRRAEAPSLRAARRRWGRTSSRACSCWRR